MFDDHEWGKTTVYLLFYFLAVPCLYAFVHTTVPTRLRSRTFVILCLRYRADAFGSCDSVLFRSRCRADLVPYVRYADVFLLL